MPYIPPVSGLSGQQAPTRGSKPTTPLGSPSPSPAPDGPTALGLGLMDMRAHDVDPLDVAAILLGPKGKELLGDPTQPAQPGQFVVPPFK